ncbi:deoxynucleoside kinase [Nicoliella spurrieriana]|uniref:Deoxynucleoside kinase n=1 Tax=Nicoliella spurrieriana TaxID=2925830 RepID=A0A976RST6_9LACO|nr:deoxynucleoside kinase [Nicoliella spurrieriana]UQS87202.1 deoxynucleoside kinase [Nicoliella spurrieriana]
MPMLVLAGTIGAGKSSLTTRVAKHLGTKAFYEPVGDNPVLPLFYQDKQKYGFLLQIYFLNKRFEMIKRAQRDDNNVLDRSIYEDALFTDLNHRLGNINDAEAAIYHELLDNMMEELPFAAKKKRPDLLVYIEVSLDTQLARIKKRGRDFEQSDELLDYYRELRVAYQKWFQNYDISPKLKIDGDQYDFVNSAADLTAVLNQIDAKLNE